MKCSFSALDDYFGIKTSELCPVSFELFDGDLVSLAKCTDNLSFDSLPYADACVNITSNDSKICRRVRYICADNKNRFPENKHSYPQTALVKLDKKQSYDARFLVYENLHNDKLIPKAKPYSENFSELTIFEAAVMAARYSFNPIKEKIPLVPENLSPIYLRDLLELVLTGKYPGKGLEILYDCGLLKKYLPEIFELKGVTQSKDFHPEGDAWQHTLETFEHRKTPELLLSFALLLHDTGKVDAIAEKGKRFARHSELGERSARALLNSLLYPKSFIDDVAFLVRYHMLPAALPGMPYNAMGGILANRLIPELLELYRCDELSMFRGPDAYYEACAVYKSYLKATNNPYRKSFVPN